MVFVSDLVSVLVFRVDVFIVDYVVVTADCRDVLNSLKVDWLSKGLLIYEDLYGVNCVVILAVYLVRGDNFSVFSRDAFSAFTICGHYFISITITVYLCVDLICCMVISIHRFTTAKD